MRYKMLGVISVCVLASSLAAGQATRTWVSGVGDDANPCSRTAPCKTFAGAISKTAAGGEIDALDPGGFGAVTITKPITIDGGGGQVASILVSGTNGIVVSAGANDVVILRNLRFQGINGSGLNGIVYVTGGTLIVEDCNIEGFSNNGIWVKSGSNGHLVVRRTTAMHNLHAGIEVDTGTAAVEDSNLSANANGLLLFSATVTAVRTTVAQNSSRGFVAGSGQLNLVDSTATNNLFGIDSAGTVRISNVTITNNSVGISYSGGGQVVSWGNNHVAGNGSTLMPNFTVQPQ